MHNNMFQNGYSHREVCKAPHDHMKLDMPKTQVAITIPAFLVAYSACDGINLGWPWFVGGVATGLLAIFSPSSE
jgi:hypothetical protein